MRYRFYKRFLIVFFVLFVPLVLLNQFEYELAKIVKHRSFWIIIYYAFPIFSITLLYFGIYAFLCGIKSKSSQKIDGPITFIVIGSIFTLLSFGSPIVSYFLIPDEIFEPISSAGLQTLQKSAIDISKKPEDRLVSAELYYIKTGEAIEYFDEIGKRILYIPDNSVKERRNNQIQYIREGAKMASMAKTNIISHISIAIVSVLGFLVLLWHKSKDKKRKRGI